ncbi:hypothetical protein PG988_012328 [Apiospora saccharicola]
MKLATNKPPPCLKQTQQSTTLVVQITAATTNSPTRQPKPHPLVPAGPRRTTTGSSRIATARGYQSVVDETPPADPNPFSDDGGDLGPIDDSNDDDDDDSSSSSNHMSFLFVHWPEIMAYCIFVLISLMCPFLAAYDWIYNGNGGGWLYWVGVFVLSIPALSFPVLLWLYTKEGC